MLSIYRRCRAVGYAHQPLDPLLIENLTIVDGLMRTWERQREADASGTSLAMQLISLLPKPR